MFTSFPFKFPPELLKYFKVSKNTKKTLVDHSMGWLTGVNEILRLVVDQKSLINYLTVNSRPQLVVESLLLNNL